MEEVEYINAAHVFSDILALAQRPSSLNTLIPSSNEMKDTSAHEVKSPVASLMRYSW